MELKYQTQLDELDEQLGSNRTFMELKLLSRIHRLRLVEF